MENAIFKLLQRNNINISAESVTFVYKDAVITAALDEETASIKVDVTFVDKVVDYSDRSVEELVEGDDSNVING